MTLPAVPPTRGDETLTVTRPASLGKITTRPTVAQDSAFMLELYASTSKDLLDHLGWSIGSQRTFVIMQAQTEEWNRARLYPGMDRLTICVDELPVGRLLVCMRNDILHLVDLSLLPRYRGCGIGTQLMGEILGEARNARVPVKVRVRKDSGSVRFVERLGFATPTDLGQYVELTWMPPLTALGPDAREEGFGSHGTRAHRSTAVEAPPADHGFRDGAFDNGGLHETPGEDAVTVDAVATVDEVDLLAAEPGTPDEPLGSRSEEAEQPIDAVADDEPDEVNEAVQQYVAEADVEYLAEPAWLAPAVAEPESADVEEEPAGEEAVRVEEDPEVAARNAEFRESLAATDEFTSNFTSTFSAEVQEDDDLPFGADRYDPFA